MMTFNGKIIEVRKSKAEPKPEPEPKTEPKPKPKTEPKPKTKKEDNWVSEKLKERQTKNRESLWTRKLLDGEIDE
jgi:protein TonB